MDDEDEADFLSADETERIIMDEWCADHGVLDPIPEGLLDFMRHHWGIAGHG